MKQAQVQAQQFQEKLKKAQDSLADSPVVGESGAGLVKITMCSKADGVQAKKIEIDDNK